MLVAAPQRHVQARLDERDVLDGRDQPAHDRPGEQVNRESDIDETGPRRYVKSVTQARFGAPVRKFRLSRSGARRIAVPGFAPIVVLVRAPRITPRMPSSRIRRSTVRLPMSGKPLRRSHLVIFRRP